MGISRTSISHSQRVALRQHYQTTDPKPSHADLILWFKFRFDHDISQSMVSRSLSDDWAHLDVCKNSVSEYRKRNCQWPWLETSLTYWLQSKEDGSRKVSHDLIGRKARQLWEQSEKSEGLTMPKFSVGWIVKFRHRHEIRLQQIAEQRNKQKIRKLASQEQLATFLPHSGASTTSVLRSAFVNSQTDTLVTLSFSSDHLIHLIQHNVLRALMSNKSVVHRAVLRSEASGCVTPIKQFPTTLCHGFNIINPLPNQHIPNSLYPTQLQMSCAHTDWINMFPFPKFRDNLIRKGVDFVPEDLCQDLFGDIFPDYTSKATSRTDEFTACMLGSSSIQPISTSELSYGIEDLEDPDDYSAGRKCLINWGEPCRVENWEVTPGFLRKWGWTLEGCEDLIQASNYWRALRDEKPLTQYP